MTYPEKLSTGEPNRAVNLAFNYRNFPDRPPLRVNGCHLQGEELILVGRTAAGSEVPLGVNSLCFAHEQQSDCPNESNRYSFQWMAHMASVGAGTVKDEVLNGDGEGLLGARLRLTEGLMRTHSFRMLSPSQLIRWKFGGVTSALAEEVVWEFTFNDAEVVEVVVKSSILGDGKLDPLVLRPRSDCVEAWIVNMPLGSLIGIDPVDPLKPSEHFDQFYRLACGSHPNPDIPTPDHNDFCTPLVPRGPSNPKCPPALFSS